MGILAVLFGAVILAPAVFFITLLAANIIFADCLIVSIICAVLMGAAWHVHPMICIVFGCLVMAGMTRLYLKEKSGHILAFLSTVFWAYLAGFLVMQIGGDLLWSIFAAVVTGVLVWVLHRNIRNMMGL